MEKYDFKAIESKWQKYWSEQELFAADTGSGDREKMYVLDMFPYPSGDGLHVGHAKIYTASDVVARYWRMKGRNVLHPTGWDAFGLPTENSAIKLQLHPADLTKRNVDRFRKQMQRLGFSYDWQREINTSDPKYYKWTQWIFLQLYKAGLAYEDTVAINWCPNCKTGLANEEVIDGKCERCGTLVEQKPMRQWLLKITDYAEKLLDGLDDLAWPDSIIEMQRNWIGRSEGAEIEFKVQGAKRQAAVPVTKLEVFTTRPDTLFGATYMVVAPEHGLIEQYKSFIENYEEVKEYVHQAAGKTDLQRTDLAEEKTGVELKGVWAVNPVNNESMPVWVSDYVLMSYGTGAIMAVPAHDERDFEFAKKFDLPIVQVIEGTSGDELPYAGDGTVVQSGQFNGQESGIVRNDITAWLEKKNLGRRAIHYKLRDWVFSRQRYWGEPIPIIHCEECGTVPVPEEHLPVVLPEVEKYEPTGTGESPLAAIDEWVQVACPQCGGAGRRETNTMPQWAGSSWYFLRYVDPDNDKELAGQAALKEWLPVDMYIGGAEHAVLHLLYARFWTKALFDAGILSFAEPFVHLRGVGLVMGEDGQKMSKSRGNVINPDDVVERFGADTLRVYEMFMGPFAASVAWDTQSINGAHRFVRRVWETILRLSENGEDEAATSNDDIELAFQRTIKQVTESTEQFRFNTAISALMELLNLLEQQTRVNGQLLKTYVLLLSPYAPHLAEELWGRLGHGTSIAFAPWPQWSKTILQQAEVTIPVQVNGKVRGEVVLEPGSTSEENVEAAARQLTNVAKYLSEGEVTQVVYVPDRLINFVVA